MLVLRDRQPLRFSNLQGLPHFSLLVASHHRHTAPSFQMLFHAAGKGGDFIDELRQRGGVALTQLTNASGQGLGNTIQLALYRDGQGGQPFIVHHQSFDLGFAKLRVFSVDLVVEAFLSFLSLALRILC